MERMAPHLPILRRVGIVLLIYFGLHLFSLAGDLLSEQTHSFTIDLSALVLGLLLMRGNLAAARVATFLNSLTLALTAGGLVALAVVFALHLGPRIELPHASFHEWLLAIWTTGWCVADLGVTVWIVRELREPAVEVALAHDQRGSTRTSLRWGVGVGLALATLILPLAIVLHRVEAELEPLAFAAAEQRIGAGWQMQLVSFSKGPVRWTAHVTARRGDEVREVDVGDPPPVVAR